MTPRSKGQYVYPTEAMSTSAQAAHYLQFCHSQRPGERIKYPEMAKVIHRLSSVPRSDHTKVRSLRLSSAHIRVALRSYGLGMQSNKDGIRVLSHVHDIVKVEVAAAAGELETSRRKLSERLAFADTKSHQYENTPEGKALKRFASRARAASDAVSRELPTVKEVKGLLTSGDEDD